MKGIEILPLLQTLRLFRLQTELFPFLRNKLQKLTLFNMFIDLSLLILVYSGD